MADAPARVVRNVVYHAPLVNASESQSDIKFLRENIARPVKSSDLNALPRWTRPLVITIDGPAGSGKSTVARLVAETIGYQFIDTGATYRALAWLAIDRGISFDDANRLRALAIAHPVVLGFDRGRWCVRISNVDVTDEIRSPQIDDAASRVAAHEEVRDVLVARQRQFTLSRDSVLDGRDCGTRVRPDADLKLYVTASLEERARRRAADHDSDDSAVGSAITERDERDRAQSGAADDAIRHRHHQHDN